MRGERNNGKRTALILTAILLAGLISRVIWQIQLSNSDIGKVLPLDMVFYRDLAAAMSSGSGVPGGAISYNPLYPFCLAAVFRMAGTGLLVPRMIQSAIGLTIIFLVFAAGRRIAADRGSGGSGRDSTGLVAAALALLYPQFYLYEGALLATTLVTFIFAALFTLSLTVDRDMAGPVKPQSGVRRVPPWLSSCALGLLCGVGALGRPNIFLLLIPSVPVWLFFKRGRSLEGTRHALACLAGSVLILLPSTLHNASVSGRFVPVSTHGGINFYIGNRAGSTGIYDPPSGMRADMRGLIEDSRNIAVKETGRDLNEAQVSAYWMGRARESIMSDPAGYCRLVGRKMLLFWNGTEVSDIVDLSIYRKECPVLGLFFVPFTAISTLAFPGFILLILSRRNRTVTFLLLGSAMASTLLFYTNARYRVPSAPLMIVMAAFFLTWLFDQARSNRWNRIVPAVALSAAFFFLVSGRRMVEVDKSAAYTFLGNHYMENGQADKGDKAFAEAYRLSPGLVMTNINYARVLLRQGRLEESRKLYDSAWSKDPAFPMLAVEYGSLLHQMGRKDESVEKLRHALTLGRDREGVLACRLLSRAAYESGMRAEAAAWIRRALEIAPGDKQLQETLQWLEGGG